MTSSLRERAALLGAVIAVLGLLAYVTSRTNRPASISVALARGQTPDAPGFVLPRLGAPGSIDLATLRGRVVVINFWASWCVPCREEAVALEATWQRYQDRQVVVLGVNVQDLMPEAERFLQQTKTTYPPYGTGTTACTGPTVSPVCRRRSLSVARGRIIRKFPGAVTDTSAWSVAVEETLRR